MGFFPFLTCFLGCLVSAFTWCSHAGSVLGYVSVVALSWIACGLLLPAANGDKRFDLPFPTATTAKIV